MKTNLVLKQFASAVYCARADIPNQYRVNYRIERANGGLLCDLWFLTTGCRHDAQGGCTMCNYGKSSLPITSENKRLILADLKRIVHELPWTFEDFLLTSSGSILDPMEVPPEMWEELLPILEHVRTKRFMIETRAETVTDDAMRFLKQIQSGEEKYVEIGLESSSDWVLQHCINKASTFEDFRRAVQRAHAYGILVTANIGLGIPFLNERTNIQEAVRSIQDALKAGADSIVLLPYHVKSGTVADILYQNGRYQCVSLWALVEVLSYFPMECDRIQISWYKDYFGPEKSFIRESPKTCPDCAAEVIKELDRYRSCPNRASIERLHHHPCTCHDAWRKNLASQPVGVDLAEMEQSYRFLTKIFETEPALLNREIARMKKEYKEMAE